MSSASDFDSNPYRAPSVDPEIEPGNQGKRLASRAQRLGAATLDGLFAWIVGGALAFLLRALGLDPGTPDARFAAIFGSYWPSPLLMEITSLVPLAIEWWLIGSMGQSVGKRVLGLRIALADGRTAGVKHGVLLRALPRYVLATIPSVMQLGSTSIGGPVLSVSFVVGVVLLVDLAMIFNLDHRCLHDRIAGTWVVSLR